ncbi:tRNA glutamyl-Q(34) synthetase GluQRS [Methyloglobulus sp.]|uniref:tRNA glutamyl-Q(34) synthetase GluQRS n=1 Tax=Methyloglobulus sp. TaxID=2518622 RepID=UPI0032B7B96A
MAILPMQSVKHDAYIGRFAPSPTGPLHLGSLFTALASFLHARHHHGKWLLRVDDLDTPRNKEGSVSSILKTLEAFALHWDNNVYYQSQHLDSYHHLLSELEQNQLTYRCNCSRKSLAEMFPDDTPKNNIYPGICRNKSLPSDTQHAIRLKTEPCTLCFQDELQGLISHDLAKQHGDFILKRKDGVIAYQFAVVIDDYLQGVNHVVRGSDLLEETPKQTFLQQLLGFSTPTYLHVPVIVDHHGYKLSKQTLATAVDTKSTNKSLFDLLVLLKQNPPDELDGASVSELLDWAIMHWCTDELALCSAISL